MRRPHTGDDGDASDRRGAVRSSVRGAVPTARSNRDRGGWPRTFAGTADDGPAGVSIVRLRSVHTVPEDSPRETHSPRGGANDSDGSNASGGPCDARAEGGSDGTDATTTTAAPDDTEHFKDQ